MILLFPLIPDPIGPNDEPSKQEGQEDEPKKDKLDEEANEIEK